MIKRYGCVLGDTSGCVGNHDGFCHSIENCFYKKELEKDNTNNKVKEISEMIYRTLCYADCGNCRYYSEIPEDVARRELRYWPCEKCHRKHLVQFGTDNWAISNRSSYIIAENICKLIEE